VLQVSAGTRIRSARSSGEINIIQAVFSQYIVSVSTGGNSKTGLFFAAPKSRCGTAAAVAGQIIRFCV